MYKIMNDYTLAHYFLSIISYHVSGATELFILSDSNNDATGAITQRNNSEKKEKKNMLVIEVLTITVKYWEIIEKQQ